LQGNTNFKQPEEAVEDLPNANTARTLGVISLISSILLAWCYGIGIPVAAVTGIIGLIMSHNARLQYTNSPGVYSEDSYSLAKIGKTTSIISLCICGIWLLILACFFVWGFYTGLRNNRPF